MKTETPTQRAEEAIGEALAAYDKRPSDSFALLARISRQLAVELESKLKQAQKQEAEWLARAEQYAEDNRNLMAALARAQRELEDLKDGVLYHFGPVGCNKK